jgi:hypothetical protein
MMINTAKMIVSKKIQLTEFAKKLNDVNCIFPIIEEITFLIRYKYTKDRSLLGYLLKKGTPHNSLVKLERAIDKYDFRT